MRTSVASVCVACGAVAGVGDALVCLEADSVARSWVVVVDVLGASVARSTAGRLCVAEVSVPGVSVASVIAAIV